MMYERELKPLLSFVRKHPGLTASGIEKEIRKIPWPEGIHELWRPPYDGTRLAKDCPSISSIKWKLRYMELTGDIRKVRGNWFAI